MIHSLWHECQNNVIQKFQLLTLPFLFISNRKLVPTLERLCNKQAKKNDNHGWLLILPILHFLRGDCKPYIEPTERQNTAATWCGVSELKVEILRYKLINVCTKAKYFLTQSCIFSLKKLKNYDKEFSIKWECEGIFHLFALQHPDLERKRTMYWIAHAVWS